MKRFTLLYLKGIAMGIADLVPGISGGTVALLTGIYEQLIHILARLDWRFVWALLSFNGKKLKNDYSLDFLIILLIGILSGIAASIQFIHYALTYYLPITFAFFFGLICSSLFTIIHRDIHIGCLIIGIACGLGLVLSGGLNMSFSLANIFFAGSIAICAMLLPGISGSFILLILGIYQPLIAAVISLDLLRISIFVSGALVGLFLFSRLIRALLNLHRHRTISVLIGLMIGTLIRLWPWQHSENGFILLSPSAYTQITSHNSYALNSLIFFIIGGLFVIILKRISIKISMQ